MIGALYVHVPFCARKCAYCDFLSKETAPDDPCMDRFVSERVREIESYAQAGLLSHCKTAYIGGGTPTMLGAERLSLLVAAVKSACPCIRELTCEANPDSLTENTIQALLEAGATRVSVGVQSLYDTELSALGRIHTARQATDCVRLAVASGLDVSVDLMCAIEHQTESSWKATIQAVAGLGVGHVSVYPLSIEQGTRLGDKYGLDVPDFNDEDVQADRMELAEAELSKLGLARYEVASYAKEGKACEHNIAYWTGVSYLGLGDGAASMLDACTYDAARSIATWLPCATEDFERARFNTHDREVEFLSAREAWAEDLMLGMRLTRGVPLAKFKDERQSIEKILSRGLAARRGNRIVPTHKGWILGNELFGILWDLA